MEEAASPALRAYQDGVERLRRSSCLEYPAHVHVETLALCNAACGFCPYPTLDRKGVRMSDALLDKVLTDLEDIPRAHPFQLSPFKVNEPFLDVRLFDLLARVDERLPHATVTLTTNASPVTQKTLEKLSRFPRLGYLWISVNDYRPAEYEAAMSLPFQRTLERLQMIHEAKAQGRFPARVVLSRVGDRSEHDLYFRVWVGRTFPLFQSSVFPRGGWIGQVDAQQGPIPDVGCQRWFDISITSTGIVAHCCMDGKAEHPIGDVGQEHVLEIYNNPEYRRLRESTASRLEVQPCATCAFL